MTILTDMMSAVTLLPDAESDRVVFNTAPYPDLPAVGNHFRGLTQCLSNLLLGFSVVDE